jgi:hypothetical protein
MDIETLTRFFMWCTIINGVLLTFWTIVFGFAPGLVYRAQSKWFRGPRETVDEVERRTSLYRQPLGIGTLSPAFARSSRAADMRYDGQLTT